MIFGLSLHCRIPHSAQEVNIIRNSFSVCWCVIHCSVHAQCNTAYGGACFDSISAHVCVCVMLLKRAVSDSISKGAAQSWDYPSQGACRHRCASSSLAQQQRPLISIPPPKSLLLFRELLPFEDDVAPADGLHADGARWCGANAETRGVTVSFSHTQSQHRAAASSLRVRQTGLCRNARTLSIRDESVL